MVVDPTVIEMAGSAQSSTQMHRRKGKYISKKIRLESLRSALRINKAVCYRRGREKDQ